MSKDDYSRAVITEGQRRAITERGIVIALATCLVESNLTMYANAKVPASMSIPHDAVGSDGYSVGLFQQQVRDTGNGWWWGSAATCMDPTLSAGLFYDRLAKLNYNGPNSPGSYAQAVQGSAFPDRYDKRIADAQAIYDRLATGAQPVTDPKPAFNEYANWGSNSSSRGSTVVDLFLLHTNEGDNNADSLAKFLRSTEGGSNPVAYHYCVSEDYNDHGVTVVDVIDTDRAAWAVGNSNGRSINLCFAGSKAAWTTDQWMAQSKAIDVAAYLAVQDCRKYGVKIAVIPPPYAANPPGIADHRYCTQKLKDGNNHTDVGDNFPWPYFAERVNFWAAGGTTETSPVVTPPASAAPQPVGPADDQITLRWNCLGGQTVVEALAELRDKILGTNDRSKTGAK
jgi:N-acetyl-anhydromuramyl-L-alanine amidase AmpD